MENNNELPEGLARFENTMQYVFGMIVYVDWFYGDSFNGPQCCKTTAKHMIPGLNPNIPIGTFCYQKLTPEMLWGEKSWWEENEIGKYIKPDRLLECLLEENHNNHLFIYKHAWLFEQDQYNTHGIDLTKYRTPNHPQYQP